MLSRGFHVCIYKLGLRVMSRVWVTQAIWVLFPGPQSFILAPVFIEHGCFQLLSAAVLSWVSLH